MSPEGEYLARLIRCYAERGDVPPPMPRDVDPEELVTLLAAQGVVGTFGALLTQLELPERVAKRVEELLRFLKRRDSILSLEISRLLPALAGAGFRVVLLKGAALARTAYDRSEHRLSSDVDILVERGSLDDVCDLLARLDYRQAAGRNHPSFYEQHHFHRILSGPAGMTLEVHWNLSRPDNYFQFDLDGFFGRSREIDRDGIRVQVPADIDQLLHATCQALEAGYSDIRRVIDAALLLRNGAGDDPLLPQLARSQGLATALWGLLQVQQELSGMPVSADLERSVRPEAFVRRCLDSLALPERALDSDARRRAALAEWILFLCSPSIASALSETRKYLVPGEPQLLGYGYQPDALPNWWTRGSLGARRAWFLAKMMAHQGRCLAIDGR